MLKAKKYPGIMEHPKTTKNPSKQLIHGNCPSNIYPDSHITLYQKALPIPLTHCVPPNLSLRTTLPVTKTSAALPLILSC